MTETRLHAILLSLMPALKSAGYIDSDGNPIGDPDDIASDLIVSMHRRSTDPWGEPFAMMLHTEWCSIDGTEPGNVQACVTENGVLVKERQPAMRACTKSDHLAELCGDCWATRPLQLSSKWLPVTACIQVRIGNSDDATPGVRRIEVRRRAKPGTPQPESVWSDPWVLPKDHETDFYKAHRDDRTVDATWVDATPQGDVQISRGHTFPRGILVRRATGSAETPWTTPAFIAQTHWRWVNLLADGSLQFRCWKPTEEKEGSGNYRIEVRQQVGRTPVLAVEPTWGEIQSGWSGQSHSNGYTMSLLREPYRGYSSIRNVIGVRVIDPSGEPRDILATERNVLAAPGLLVNASSQGSFYWRHSEHEPRETTIAWTMPERRTLRNNEWTMLSETLRAKAADDGVLVEIRQGTSEWIPYGRRLFETTHKIDGARVTFHPDNVAEIQHAVSSPRYSH